MTHALQPCFFLKIHPQTDRQAHCAFAASSDTNVLDVIIALGDYWTYREYHQNDLEQFPSLSEQRDTSFEPSS